jgi:hypothetical protein
MVRSALLLLLLAVGGCSGQVSSESLAETAINGSTPAEREKAILELTRRGQEVVPLIRRVAAEAKTTQVRAVAIQALGTYRDFKSGPMLLDALDDSELQVRGAAGAALVPILSANYHFRADDPPAKRQMKAKAMRKSFEVLLTNPEYKARLER